MLGNDIYIKNNLYSRRTKLIEKLLKYKINGNYAELKLNTPYVAVLIGTAALTLGAVSAIAIHHIRKSNRQEKK